MGFRFRRSVKLAPGVRLNISKSGPSVSFGRRGARVTVGKDRITKTVGIPGTGLSYTDTDYIGTKKKSKRRRKSDSSEGYNDINGTNTSNDVRVERVNEGWREPNYEGGYDTKRPKAAGCFALAVGVLLVLMSLVLAVF
jgi:hypothetical protein